MMESLPHGATWVSVDDRLPSEEDVYTVRAEIQVEGKLYKQEEFPCVFYGKPEPGQGGKLWSTGWTVTHWLEKQ